MRFADLLTVHQVAEGTFSAVPEGDGFLFGGLTLGLALRAAGQTVREGMAAKSFRANFLRPGQWGAETTLSVQTLIDGRSLALRQVSVLQQDRVLAVMTASFHIPGTSVDWQLPAPAGIPAPAELAAAPAMLPVSDLIEVRPVNPSPADPLRATVHPFWGKPVEPLGPDEALHCSVLAFFSDYLVILSMLGADPTIADPTGTRTLEQSVWFHRPVNADDWLLYSADPASIAVGKGLARGTVHSTSGALIASFAQEVNIPG
ncbi:MAG: Choloyl-CoA hydrolase [Frankiales bacterium]|nr:Choloyl-CoA hydrolase [Frankiales bacterium]